MCDNDRETMQLTALKSLGKRKLMSDINIIFKLLNGLTDVGASEGRFIQCPE